MFKRRDTIFLLGMMFLTVVAWVGFTIYHIAVTSTIEEEIQVQIVPINPNFDSVTLDNLKKRNAVAPLYRTRGSSVEISGAESASQSGRSVGVGKVSPGLGL